jgi:hypothetical protein
MAKAKAQPKEHRHVERRSGARRRTPVITGTGMKEVLTMKELESRYSGEWVLLVNPVHNKLMEPIRGELSFHSKDRSEVYKEAHKRKDAHTAIFYVGELPEDLVVVL